MRVTRSGVLVLAALLCAPLAGLVVVMTGGEGARRFSAVVPAAHNLLVGQRINTAGKNIGRVTAIEPLDRGHRARISMEITDGDYWPLARDTSIEIRLGGTVSFSDRYILLRRGRDLAHPLPSGGHLASSHVKIPVEVDELLPVFDRRTRRDLKGMIRASSTVLDRSSGDVHRLLGRSGPLTESAAAVFEDLSASPAALRSLVRSAGHVVDAVDRSNPGVRTLLDGAARTFDAVAEESDNLRTSLTQMPAALRQTRSTLTRAGSTLRNAGRLTREIAPGVDELARTAAPLDGTLTSLQSATPTLRRVLRRSQALSDTGGFFYRLRDNGPQLTSLLKQATTQIGCVRPWAPELMLFTSTWADWMSPVDSKDHYVRATAQNFLPVAANSSGLTPAQVKQAFPSSDYGFPRPPGALAGQPWFQPQCGVGPESLDPSKDKEAATFGSSAARVPSNKRGGP
jgi:ABC-type transporter Mla subunit MlaD